MNRRYMITAISILALALVGTYVAVNLNEENDNTPNTQLAEPDEVNQGLFDFPYNNDVARYDNDTLIDTPPLPDDNTNTTVPNNNTNQNRATTSKIDIPQNQPQTTTPKDNTTKNNTTTIPKNNTVTIPNKTTIPENNNTTPNNNTGTQQPTTGNKTTTTGISNYANEVIKLVNQERAKAGLSALSTNATLTSAANKRAEETVVSFSHTRPNGTQFSTVFKEYGVSYRAAGENIAYGQKTPQEVVTGWMNSPGHRANILNGNFGKIGVGVHQNNGVIYWVQLFTN